MIQDRLTAKFLSAKLATRRALKPAAPKSPSRQGQKPSAIEVYSRGRPLPASVWL